MEYKDLTVADGRLISLSGRITSRDYDAFKSLMSLFDEMEGRCVAIDFSAVEFIDSTALGMIMLLRDKAQSKKIRMTMQGVKGQVRRLMDLVKFDQVMA